jgi:hypothetical protein
VQESALIKAGLMKPDEAWFCLKDVQTGASVRLHAGTVNWNPFRKKWIMIAVEILGKPSVLGEVWYTESDQPQGPYLLARKVVTHNHSSFYNPAHHPFFDQDGGKIIYFEGTYTTTFSGNDVPTPRYDYNQIMYRLDLSDPRLKLDEKP